jgi:DNA polymerase-3 subunit beta
MKFVCEKSAFQKEITFAQEIISSRNAVSVISNVYLETVGSTLIIRATDIKIGFETRLPVEVLQEGSLTVFCDKLTGILASIPEGTIEVEQHDSRVSIKPSFKKVQFHLKTIGSEQFPQLSDIDDDRYFGISLAEFKEMISQTVFAVSDDETRYFMNGVYFERAVDGLAMVATDGRRLAYIKRPITEGVPEFKGVIIPPKILSLVLHRGQNEGLIELAVTEKNLFIKFGTYRLSTVLIEGQFPNYQKVIPEKQLHELTVKRQDVIDALKRVSIFVEQKSRRTYMNLSTDKLIIASEENEIGTAKEELQCVYEGPDAIIAMNYKYIEEPLKVIDSDEIKLRFTETSRAVTITAEPASDYFHILMPMQPE